jgi:hypothetical protein
MHRWYNLLVLALLSFTALLTACSGGSAATNTPTAAPTATPPATVGAVSTTRPASPVATGSFAAPTTVSPASAVTGTRAAGSATTGSVAAGTTAAGSVVTGAGFTLFTDPKGFFSFSRPAAWTVGQSTATNSVVQFTTTNPLGVVDVSTEPVASGVTPNTYQDAALAEIKKGIPDARQVGMTTLKLDNEPAVQIDYTGTVSGSTIAFSQVFALHKGTAYILTLGTAPENIEAMKQQAVVVIQTWKFLQ